MPTVFTSKNLHTRYRNAILMLAGICSTLMLAGCSFTEGGLNSSSTGSVTLYWSRPVERFNGELLENSDIAGYAIRYRHQSETRFTRVFLENDGVNSFHFDAIKDPANTLFQVAAVDQAGLYSNYETAKR